MKGTAPFQSRGCRTCKRRRIKCDQQKPQCLRCQKTGLECLGYDEPRSFVIFTPNRPYQTLASMTGSDNQIHFARPEYSDIPENMPPAPMIRAQLYSTFLDAYFPTRLDDAWYSVVTSWPTQPANTELFEKSLTAWACTSLGKAHSDQNLIGHGLRIYNQAILLMSNMIRQDPYQEDIVYSLMIWTELESHYLADDSNAWTAHWSVFKRLVGEYQRHRPFPTNQTMKLIFDPFQRIIMTLAIMTDGISAEQYDYIMGFAESSPFDELLRLAAISAMLFNLSESIDRCDETACTSLLEKCIMQREDLMKWSISRHTRENPDEIASQIANEEPLSHRAPLSEALFGPAYHFPSMKEARLDIMFFNSMRLVHGLISKAKSLLPTHMRNGILPENYDIRQALYYADNIARSIPFCLQERNRACLAHLSILLLGQISQTYIATRSTDRLLWCQHTLSAIADLGYSSARHRQSIMLKHWVEPPTQRGQHRRNTDWGRHKIK